MVSCCRIGLIDFRKVRSRAAELNQWEKIGEADKRVTHLAQVAQSTERLVNNQSVVLGIRCAGRDIHADIAAHAGQRVGAEPG